MCSKSTDLLSDDGRLANAICFQTLMHRQVVHRLRAAIVLSVAVRLAIAEFLEEILHETRMNFFLADQFSLPCLQAGKSSPRRSYTSLAR